MKILSIIEDNWVLVETGGDERNGLEIQCNVHGLKMSIKRVDIYYALAANSKYIDYLYRHKVLETGKVFRRLN